MVTLYLSRRIKTYIMLGIVIISIIVALSRSHIVKNFLHPEIQMGKPPEKANVLFDTNKYDTKLKMVFSTKNIVSLKNKINEIVNKNDLKDPYSKNTDNNTTKLIEIPKDKYKMILAPLFNSKYLISDELLQSTEYVSIEDLNNRIESAEAFKEKILSDLAKTRNPYTIKDLHANLHVQNNVIDSLKNLINQKKERANYILTRIDISKYTTKGDILKSSLKSFGSTFLISFIFITVALFIIYLIIISFTKLFKILGIRTTRGGGSRYYKYDYGGKYGSKYGYGYYSGYGDYGYGSRRKVKRKYIRKPKPEEEKEEKKKEEVQKKEKSADDKDK